MLPLYFALWLIQKTLTILQTNQIQNLTNCEKLPKRRENKRVRTTLRKLKLLNSSWWKTNVEIQLRRAKMHTPIKVDHYPIMPHKYWCVVIRPHRLNKSTFSTSSQSAIHNLILQSTVTINPKKNNIPFSYRVYPFRSQKVCVQMWASAVRRITI